MLSAMVIDPDRSLQDHKFVQAMDRALVGCHILSRALRTKVHITWQHNIRSDHFAIIVETKVRTFGHYGRTVSETFQKLTKEIDKYLKDNFDEKLRPTKKQAAGKAGRQGRRRPRAASKRGHAPRKG
jgi:hypothetical protein